MFEELMKIAKRMKDQDNKCTANPIYLVQQKRRIYGMNPQFIIDEGEIVWLYDGEEMDLTDEDTKKAQDHYEKYYEELPGWTRTTYIDIWEFVQPFFSEKAADDYVKANRHRLTEPRVYIDSAYRNYEWQAIEKILRILSKHVTEKEWVMEHEKESLDAIHPCNHWFAERCDCRGACSCHFYQED